MLRLETVGSMSSELWDAPIQICLLGSFRVLRHGQAVALKSGGKVESFLRRLSLHRKDGVSRGALIDQLWPESDLSLAGQSLKSPVYGIRQLLGGALGAASPAIQRDGWYQLNLEAGIEVDVARFEALLDRGDRAFQQGDGDAAVRAHHQAIDLSGIRWSWSQAGCSAASWWTSSSPSWCGSPPSLGTIRDELRRRSARRPRLPLP